MSSLNYLVVIAPDGVERIVVECPACGASKVHSAHEPELHCRCRHTVVVTPALGQEIMRKLDELRRTVH